MKKYITLLTAMLIITNIHAESYIWGGRAHFQGVLINPSCSVSIENQALVSIKTPNFPIQIHFSLCPENIYNNLIIGVSEQNKSAQELIYTVPKTKNDFDFNQGLNVQTIEHKNLQPKFIHHIELPTQYDDFLDKSIAVFLNQMQWNSSAHMPNILISIFYP